MKLFMIHNGDLMTDKNNVVAMSNVATRDNTNPDFIWYRMPVISLLIEHEEGWILYDTGFHPDFAKGIGKPDQVALFPATMDKSQELTSQLEKVGITPSDIKLLILSHLHFDHIGQVDVLPQVRTLVPGEDLDLKPTFAKEHPNLQLEKIYEDMEVVKGIHLIKLPGHTDGLMGLMVELEHTGTMLFTSDAAYSSENYGPPAMPPMSCNDSKAYRASIEKIRKIADAHKATVVFGHDQDTDKRFRYLPFYYD